MHPFSRTVLVLAVCLRGVPGAAQAIGSLRGVPLPTVPNLERYVRDRDALVVLGKALFWDMQVGSDGRTACASCHFHAGADHRAQNQLSDPNNWFPVNHTQVVDDFPFRQFADPANNRSTVLRDSGMRAGSAGVFRRNVTGTGPDAAVENGTDLDDTPAFRLLGLNVRQVTPRNTPSVFNAVFNVRNFWDGRASNIFSGVTPFGLSDPRANALRVEDGRLTAESVRLDNSSLASQAVGPPLSGVEMSYNGRDWKRLGRKILAAAPLALQAVSPEDSVLGGLANPEGRGLLPGMVYLDLVKASFQPAYWDSDQTQDGYTAPEINFSVFFGLSIQAYESTLISAESRFDRFSEGESAALTSQEVAGMRLFQGRGECTDCHLGPEFTNASFTSIARRGLVTSLRTGLFVDTGFVHTGVRTAAEDPGMDQVDDFGVTFSLAARQAPAVPLGIRGAFKTPGLRNVEFTGPYFHNGGQATLEQVVEFYDRGGDLPNSPNLSPDVHRLNLSPADREALVAFLKSLTDDRVKFERAPFDHPELCVPVGYAEPPAADTVYPLSATDRWAALPAVGRNGNLVPLQTFAELLQGIGADGSRAHTLMDTCSDR